MLGRNGACQQRTPVRSFASLQRHQDEPDCRPQTKRYGLLDELNPFATEVLGWPHS